MTGTEKAPAGGEIAEAFALHHQLNTAMKQQIDANERHVFVAYEERRPEIRISAHERMRPLNSTDAALFHDHEDLGAIIRDAKLCDAYNPLEVVELEETWAFHIQIVFRSGFQLTLHVGKSLTSLMGKPVDVALAQYDVLLKLCPEALDDPERRRKISIADAVIEMGATPARRRSRRKTMH